MRKAIVYFLGLGFAATVVFLTTYLFGRHPSLEQELERWTTPRPVGAPEKSKGIPSLQQVEPPPAPAADPVPAAQPLGEGIQVTRTPLEASGLVIVADLPALLQVPGGDGPQPLREGLTRFLAQATPDLAVGLRTLAGAAGECSGTAVVRKPETGGFLSALGDPAALDPGPRNTVRAVEEAAADLENLPGEHAVVVITAGEEGCGGDFCGSEPPPGGGALRVYVIVLAPPAQPGAEPGLPDAGRSGMPAPVFEPSWGAPYRCLAERSGGTLAVATTPGELETALRGIAGNLESAVVVRGFHYTGQEIKGISPGGEARWGVRLRPARDDAGLAGTREAALFPAAFAVPGGVYVLKGRYCGQERTAAVAVAPGERAEVRISFNTGELYVEALDAEGGEIIGDSAGFRCAWGTEVFQGDPEEERSVASTCSFPSRIELAPGVYRMRARWRGIERLVGEFTVEAGASAVHTVSFGAAAQ